jgi:hypothetical protein
LLLRLLWVLDIPKMSCSAHVLHPASTITMSIACLEDSIRPARGVMLPAVQLLLCRSLALLLAGASDSLVS